MNDGPHDPEAFGEEMLRLFQTLLIKGFRRAAAGMWLDLFEITLMSTIWPKEKAVAQLRLIAKGEQGRAEINAALRVMARFAKRLAENEPATQVADAREGHESATAILLEICERAAEEFILNQADAASRQHVFEALQDALDDHENRWLGTCLEISDEEDGEERRGRLGISDH
jgi:hypothetical protein